LTQKVILDNYIEKDIIEFLDEQVKQTKNNYSDVTSKYKAALKNNNLGEANELLKNLSTEYNQLTSSDIYKEITLSKIQNLVKLSFTYLEQIGWNNSLGKIIKELIENDQLSGKGKITIFDKKEKEKEEKEKARMVKDYKLKSEIDKKFQELNKQMFVSIKKQDLKEAIQTYRQLKVYFDQYPGRFETEKKEYYDDILGHFIQIKKMKSNFEQKEPQKKESLEIKPETNYLKVNYINGVIDSIKKDVKKGDFDSAKAKVIELKEKINKIPSDYKRLRSILESKVNIINQRIEMSRRIMQIKEVQND
jgi:hypothetical protein